MRRLLKGSLIHKDDVTQLEVDSQLCSDLLHPLQPALLAGLADIKDHCPRPVLQREALISKPCTPMCQEVVGVRWRLQQLLPLQVSYDLWRASGLSLKAKQVVCGCLEHAAGELGGGPVVRCLIQGAMLLDMLCDAVTCMGAAEP